jgi:acyl-CoA thioesterase I
MNRRVPLRAIAALAFALLLTACGRRADPMAECRLPAGATVLAIGDSLTRGAGADGRGYPEQLQALLDAPAGRPGVTVKNLGIDGERSAGLRARIDAALAEHRPAVVLITSGGNDFLRRAGDDETVRELTAVVERVRAGGALPVLFGIPRPSLAAAVGRPSDHALFVTLADALRVPLIPGVVADVLSQEALKSDAIHPNAAGYAVMAHAAFERLARCR